MIAFVAILRTALHIHHAYKATATKNPQFIDYVGKMR